MDAPLVSLLRHGITVHFNLLVLLLLLLLPILFLKLRNHFSSSQNLRLPPNPPRLPFIGNLHQLGSLPHRSLRDLSNKYGPLMLLHLGHALAIVVSSEQVVREMIKKHDLLVSNRPKTAAPDILLYGCNDVSFSPYGEYWRQARKLCVLEMLSHKKVQSFHFVREEEVALIVNMIRQECLHGNPVNLSKSLHSVTSNIITRCVLGWKPKEEDGGNRFSDLSSIAAKQLGEFSIGDFFPSLRWMDVFTGLIARLKETAEGFDASIEHFINGEYKKNLIDDDKTSQKHFAHTLLQLQNDKRLDFQLTHEKLKALLTDMILAGIDTSFTLIEWVVSELIKNPEKMKKAREEIRKIVGTKSKVEENDVVQMEYLKCVIKETLRLHPPAPLLVPRETTSSLTLCGYEIPKKTMVLINAWAIQRDDKLWDRAEEFIPERFEDKPIDYRGQDFQFIPFGVGRKICPGSSFGIAIVEYMLANLLCWFDWKLPGDSKGEELDMTEIFGLVVAKKNPLFLVPASYSP